MLIAACLKQHVPDDADLVLVEVRMRVSGLPGMLKVESSMFAALLVVHQCTNS